MCKIQKGLPVCPVQCKYCMASKLEDRAKYWANSKRIGVNKSSVFINRAPNDPSLDEIFKDIWHLLDWDYLGYQGTSDCFWAVFRNDLEFLVSLLQERPIRRLCLISKIPVAKKAIEILKPLRDLDKIRICYSITGLDNLERTSTESRLDALERLRDSGFEVLPVIHPLIWGYTDLYSLLYKISKRGFVEFGIKGFRYDPLNMTELERSIPTHVLDWYNKISIQNTGKSGSEVFPELEVNLMLRNFPGLKPVDVKEWYQRNPAHRSEEINLDYEKEKINSLFDKCVLSTSESNTQVLKDYVLNRRLK